MANGTKGTRRAGGTISVARVAELEALHQDFLDGMKAAQGNYTEWDQGAESGARSILSDLAGKNYSVSHYQLKPTATFDPVSTAEVEANLGKQIAAYKNSPHSQWEDGYLSQAVYMLEKATGNKYSVTGYQLKKVKKKS